LSKISLSRSLPTKMNIQEEKTKGPSTLAFFASVVPFAMLGGGAIADGTTDAKNASVDAPIADWVADL
jgi:hypothetical protein